MTPDEGITLNPPPSVEKRGRGKRAAPPPIIPTPRYSEIVRLHASAPQEHISKALEGIIRLLDNPVVAEVLKTAKPRRKSDRFMFDAAAAKELGAMTAKQLLIDFKNRNPSASKRIIEDILLILREQANKNCSPREKALTDPFRELMNLSQLILERMNKASETAL